MDPWAAPNSKEPSHPAISGPSQFQAILTADMQGFSSRLKGDEETLITVVIRSYYRFSAEMAQKFSGDLFRREGDAIWCSFACPLKALEAGIWLVEELHRFNFQRPEAEQILLRTGIHWGAFASESQALFGQTLTRARELENRGQDGCLNLSNEIWCEVLATASPEQLSQLSLCSEQADSRLVTILNSRRIEIEQLESERRQARWVVAISGQDHTRRALDFSVNRGPCFALDDNRSLVIVERRSRFQLSDLEKLQGFSIAVCRGPVEERPSNDSIHREFEGRAFDFVLKMLDCLEPEVSQVVLDMTATLPAGFVSWGSLGGFPLGKRAEVGEVAEYVGPSYRLSCLCQGRKVQVVVDLSGEPLSATRQLLAQYPELQAAVAALKPWSALSQHPPERVIFSVGQPSSPQRLSLKGSQDPNICPTELLSRHSIISSEAELRHHLEPNRLMLGCRRSLSEDRLLVCLLPVADSTAHQQVLRKIKNLGCRIYSFRPSRRARSASCSSQTGESEFETFTDAHPESQSGDICRWIEYTDDGHLQSDFSQREIEQIAVSRTLWIQVGPGPQDLLQSIKSNWLQLLAVPGKVRDIQFDDLDGLGDFCDRLESGAQSLRHLSFPRRLRLRPPASAYKPLQYFGTDDSSIFFGREVELARLLRNIEIQTADSRRKVSNGLQGGPGGGGSAAVGSAPLTSVMTSLVFGRAGVGKTSFLRAGLIPHFRQPQHLSVIVRVQSDPLAALIQQLRKKLRVEQQEEFEVGLTTVETLERLLHTACARVPGTVLIVLDHFEELFLRCTARQQEQCLKTLQELRCRCPFRVYWVIGIREDFLAELTEIQLYWPDILKDLHRLQGLRQEQARRSLVSPGERFGYSWDVDLQDAVLQSLTPVDDQGIEPSLLQVVADYVVKHCSSDEIRSSQATTATGLKWGDSSLLSVGINPPKRLSLGPFVALGGTKALLGMFLDKTLEVALGPQIALTKRLLRSLVSPTGQILSLTRQQLAREANLSSAAVRPLLSSLLDLRLLRSRQEGPTFVYELSTQDFVPHILSWESAEEVAQRYATSLLKSEVQSARRLNAVIPQERLWLLGQHAPLLRLGSVEISALVRSSALQGLDPEVWMQGEQGQTVGLEILLKLLSANETPDRRKREIVAWILRDFSELSESGLDLVTDVARQVANPATLIQLERLGVNALHLELIRGAVRERFFGPSRMATVESGLAWIGSTAENKAMRKNSLRPDLHPRIDSEIDYCQIQVDTFCIDKHLVTNSEYTEFRANHVHLFPPEEAHYPVVNITYQQAQEYAAWLGKQLPSEVQWEKAARGCEGQMFPWGDYFDGQRVNSAESGQRCLTAVDRYPDGASPYGCLNMAGNVWEWTCSPWSIEDGDSLVAKKGGCAINFEPLMYCSSRFEEPPETSMRWAGFRCCHHKGLI
jgi:formylglycine-generating enzyme required for sulfatase activity